MAVQKPSVGPSSSDGRDSPPPLFILPSFLPMNSLRLDAASMGLPGQSTAMSMQKFDDSQPPDQTAACEPLDTPEPEFVSSSPALQRLLDQAGIIAPHLRIATLEGESGTGKHTLARLLYGRYALRHPDIRHWGFTRYDARDWLLSQTEPRSLAGFIFLDRVDLLGAPGQSLLLRILKALDFRQTGTLAVIGSSESSLRELARNNQFLSELALRLTSVRLTLPPLRERQTDIIPLANFFLQRLSTRYNLHAFALSASAVSCLLQHQWPGNLRELSSILESAVIECSNSIIQPEDLALPDHSPATFLPTRTPELLNLDAVIYRHILHVLHLNGGNKLRAARQLGVSRSTLYRLLEKRITDKRLTFSR
jgi:DNA-binding NtrC family response regulator